MIRRSAAVLAAASLGWLAVACLDVSSPVKGITAISPLLLPTPSVVLGDTMRDTAGKVMPLSVIAYGPNGDMISQEQFRVVFVSLDTSGGLKVKGNLAIGDSLSPTAQAVAQVTLVNGGGTIQTLPVSLPVVAVPTSANRDSGFTFTPPFSATDTLSSTLISKPLIVTVFSGTSTPVQSYPVIFSIANNPRRFAYNGPLVELTNSSGRDTTVAVTGNNGQAQIFLRFRPSAATPDQLAQLNVTPDTVIVGVQVRYRTTLLPVTPTSSFVIPIRPGGTP